jgi:hypothetical protein
MSQFNITNPNSGFSGTQTSDGGYTLHTQPSEKTSDNFGRQKVTIHQNVYEADFEYGPQPLRWEALTYGSGSIIHIPSLGGVQLSVGTGSNDLAIRQSRPYHRYQPGKTMYMSANIVFGAAVTNNYQRVGFFDDSNGVFFEQGLTSSLNPYGMYVCVRSDSSQTGSLPLDVKVPFNLWNGDSYKNNINWNTIQMIWIEYAWYGAGTIRFGITANSEQYLLHTISTANIGTLPWSRTGNLPVRYEVRNSGSVSTATTMNHFGVSVIVEGGRDAQRGFTYSYGVNPTAPLRAVATNTVRYPILSIQNRTMGTQEYTQANASISSATATSMTVTGTPWTANQWIGKFVNFPLSGSNPISSSFTARITGSTNNTIHYVDVVNGLAITGSPIPPAGVNYTIGLINRGQILPQSLVISADKTCVVELISSIPSNPIILTGSNFVPMSTLGSPNSFATRDVSATGMSGGEVVYAFVSPANSGLQVFDLSSFFPLYNTIRGNLPDILTVAVTTSGSAANIGLHLVGQEAMS